MEFKIQQNDTKERIRKVECARAEATRVEVARTVLNYVT